MYHHGLIAPVIALVCWTLVVIVQPALIGDVPPEISHRTV
jgi:hypothetical protein